MPEIGEIRALAIKDSSRRSGTKRKRHIWHACEMCGKPRWIRLSRFYKSECGVCRVCQALTLPFPPKLQGENHPQWKGGRNNRGDGYIMLRLYPDHPFYKLAGKRGYAMEHRVLMAEKLGRLLEPFPLEIVHHNNGDKCDNNIKILELMSQGEHFSLHIKKRHKEARCQI